MIPIVNVPCNGCTSCCRGDLIFLHPELGDFAPDYDTIEAFNPLTGRQGRALKHKADNTCIYLGDGGCTIHDRSPAVCREFDCRRFYRSLLDHHSRAERRRMVARNMISKDVIEAGKARLHTLEKA